MVFFSCNACNESLKKNQVEKHYVQKCRRCESVTCIDCGKEFWGDSYQTHIKCITEAEKYSGKNFVAKPNKGEVKQELWIQKVQAALQKATSNPQLKQLLQRLEEYPNIPRKRSKFENFLKCSLNVRNPRLVESVWELLMTEAKQQNGNSTANTASKEEPSSQSSVSPAEPEEQTEAAEPDDKDSEKKLNKKERKEERKRKTHKAEKKDKEESAAAEEEDGGRKKKGKRRKRDEEEEDVGQVERQPKKKKRKVEAEPAEVKEKENGAANHEEDDEEEEEERKGKFDWAATIIAVLKSKGEMSVKRLQKKVLCEYATYGSHRSEELVQGKFLKKLKKLPNVKLLKDKAQLKS